MKRIMAGTGCRIRIGISGWYYQHWAGKFYPEDLPKSDWLSYYAKKFDTVEINNTFYHLPLEQTLKKWQKVVPADFLFAVKASRYITHIKKLNDTGDELKLFFERVELLKKHLGPVLYQLPPSLRKNLDTLRLFLEMLVTRASSTCPHGQDGRATAVFEFRNESWYEDDTFKLLDEFNAGFCIHDLGGQPTPRVITGNVIYIRFHGTSGRYAGSYTEPMLTGWAKWIMENLKNATAIYAYFNNDVLGHAVANARTLKSLVHF